MSKNSSDEKDQKKITEKKNEKKKDLKFTFLPLKSREPTGNTRLVCD